MGAGNFGAGFFDGAVLAEIFVEGEADGLDGDVGGVGAFEEGSERGKLELGVWGGARGDFFFFFGMHEVGNLYLRMRAGT